MNQPAEFEDQDFSKLIDLEEMAATIAALEYTGQRFLAVMEEIFELLGQRQTQGGCTGTISRNINLRSGPGTTNEIVRTLTLSKGEDNQPIPTQVTITGQVRDIPLILDQEYRNWYLLEDGGWVASDFVTTNCNPQDLEFEDYGFSAQVLLDLEFVCGYRYENTGLNVPRFWYEFAMFSDYSSSHELLNVDSTIDFESIEAELGFGPSHDDLDGPMSMIGGPNEQVDLEELQHNLGQYQIDRGTAISSERFSSTLPITRPRPTDDLINLAAVIAFHEDSGDENSHGQQGEEFQYMLVWAVYNFAALNGGVTNPNYNAVVRNWSPENVLEESFDCLVNDPASCLIRLAGQDRFSKSVTIANQVADDYRDGVIDPTGGATAVLKAAQAIWDQTQGNWKVCESYQPVSPFPCTTIDGTADGDPIVERTDNPWTAICNRFRDIAPAGRVRYIGAFLRIQADGTITVEFWQFVTWNPQIDRS